jgi:TATA-box binding protein (TBP) (component of TFIID and TFIIIB)
MIIFENGKCRIMGCKEPLDIPNFPYPVLNIKIVSITVTGNIHKTINLHKLSKKTKCTYEPELFPALRLLNYNPLCVNVFSTGKVVILGLKTLEYQSLVKTILLNIFLLC